MDERIKESDYMSREEVQEVLMAVQALYPNFNPQNKTVTINAWCMMLEEYNVKDVTLALKTYASTDISGFAPSIGQLIGIMHDVSDERPLNEMQAWCLVKNAIRNSNYSSVEEFSKLPKLVQKTIGSPNQLRQWASDESYNEEVIKAGFMRVYRNEVEQEKSYQRMPTDTRTMIDRNKNPYFSILEQNNSQMIKSLHDEEKLKIGVNSEQIKLSEPPAEVEEILRSRNL